MLINLTHPRIGGQGVRGTKNQGAKRDPVKDNDLFCKSSNIWMGGINLGKPRQVSKSYMSINTHSKCQGKRDFFPEYTFTLETSSFIGSSQNNIFHWDNSRPVGELPFHRILVLPIFLPLSSHISRSDLTAGNNQEDNILPSR